jgi:hypothetical protein
MLSFIKSAFGELMKRRNGAKRSVNGSRLRAYRKGQASGETKPGPNNRASQGEILPGAVVK